jgi:hypothetical protein
MPEGFNAYFLRRKQEDSKRTPLLVDAQLNGLPRDLVSMIVSYSSDEKEEQPEITSTSNPPGDENQIQISYPSQCRGWYQSLYLHDNYEPRLSPTKLFWTSSHCGGAALLFDWLKSEWILVCHGSECWRGKVLDQVALRILESRTEPVCSVDLPIILEYLNHLYTSV